MTALHSALCRSALSSAFNKIPSVEPQTARRAVAMSVQQFSSYEERQHKIPSRLITSKRVKIMHKCTVHDTDVHITFRYIFVRIFFVPPVTNLESYISTVLTKVTFQLCSQKLRFNCAHKSLHIFCNNKLQENLFNNCLSVERTVTETNRHIRLFPNFLANA
jgi:hypothetical protein